MHMAKLYKPGRICDNAVLVIHIHDPRTWEMAPRVIDSVLKEHGPIHNPSLKGIHFNIVIAPLQGRILVEFPDWQMEWEGSWDDLRLMACAIADHLNMELEVDKS